MKKKLESLRQKSKKELRTALEKAKKELLKMKATAQITATKDNQAIKKKQREIARLLTIIKEKKS